MDRIRPLDDAEGEAYARLLRESPDTGQVQFAQHFLLNPITALHAQHPDATVAVAADGDGHLCGTGTVSFGSVRLHDQDLPSAYLSALAVHPAHRRRGVARALADWRFHHARARLGEDGAVYALIQQGNEGSFRTARTWHPTLVGQITIAPLPVLTTPAPAVPGLQVRPAESRDWEEIAHGLNTFNQAFAFAPHFTPASLRGWQAEEVLGQPWRQYLVCADDAGNLLAGLGMSELSRLSVLKVVSMPPALRVLNAAVRVVPANGMLRLVQLEKAFFLRGREAAARHLVRTARHAWRERGSHLSVTFDPRGPLARMYALPRWLPTTALSVALQAPAAVPRDVLVHVEV